MTTNAELFQTILSENDALKAQISEAANAYKGDPNNDRAVFEAVSAPIAQAQGVPFTYDESLATLMESRELSDEELEMVAGGTSAFYRRLVSGALAATMIFSTIPTSAFAETANSNGTSASDSQPTIVAENNVEKDPFEGVSYVCNVAATDIATSEGIIATEAGLKLAPNASAEAMAAAKDSFDFVTWGNADKAIDYTRKALSYVDEDAAKIADYGKTLFSLIKAGASLDLGDLFDNGVNLLTMMGVIEEGKKDAGVSNQQLLDEINGIRTLCDGMTKKLDEHSKELYRLRLSGFDNMIGAIESECKRVEDMFTLADQIATERGLKTPLEEPTLPPAPEFPAYPAQNPAEPVLELPAEPTTDLPAEPTLEIPPEPRHPFEFTADERWSREGETWDDQVEDWHKRYGVDEMNYTIDYHVRVMQWKQAHAAWAAERDALTAEYEREHAEWVEQYSAPLAEFTKAHAEWEAERDRIQAEYDQAHAAWENYDFNAAVAAWQAECEEIAAEHDAECKAIKTAYAEEYAKFSETYTNELIKIIEEGEAARTKSFLNFSMLIQCIDRNFTDLCTECAKSPGDSPFTAYDSFWNMQFNWETQGYYLRRAYRAKAEFALKRSYAVLASFYGLIGDPTNPHQQLTDDLQKALAGMENNGPGMSPEDVIANAKNSDWTGPELNVYCYALGAKVAYVTAECCYSSWFGGTDKQLDAILDEYMSRLNGRSVKEDLELAGILMDVCVSNGHSSYSRKTAPSEAEGIAFRSKEAGKGYHETHMLKWDGSVEDMITYSNVAGGQIHGYLTFIGYSN